MNTLSFLTATLCIICVLNAAAYMRNQNADFRTASLFAGCGSIVIGVITLVLAR